MGIALLDTSIVIGALNRDDALHEIAGRAVRTERDRTTAGSGFPMR